VARVAGLAQRRRRPPLASGNPANAALAADFSAGVLSGTRPFSVQFRDATSGEATAWLWDLGDGKSSTLQNPPQKVYRPTNSQIPAGQSSAPFTIRLTAFGPTGQNSATTPVTVNVVRFGTRFGSGVFNTCTGCHGASGGGTLTPELTAFDAWTLESAVIACSKGQPRSIPTTPPPATCSRR
jgi:PKD repeat protein